LPSDCSARQQLDHGECRSSDRAAGQRQVGAAHCSWGASGIVSGRAPGMGAIAGSDPEPGWKTCLDHLVPY
jgi:hypothetical protein